MPDPTRGGIQRLDGHHWTFRDLRAFTESTERLEIIDGVLYIHPPETGRLHQYPLGNMLYRLQRWVTRHAVGELFIAPADVTTSDDNVVQPDLSLVLASRLRRVVHGRVLCEAPDLVVEVMAPWGKAFDQEVKYAYYESIGVREYWLLDPDQQSVEVFALHGKRFESLGRYHLGQHVASELLDGFEVSVGDVYWELHEEGPQVVHG